MKVEIKPYTLHFLFKAKTSRGSMLSRKVWFLKITHRNRVGIGEVSPIPNLSPDSIENIPIVLKQLKRHLEKIPLDERKLFHLKRELLKRKFPSVVMGLETAYHDLQMGGVKKIFANGFVRSQTQIPINGLIWMASKSEMIKQINEKIEQGFTCFKLKIDSQNFFDCIQVIEYLKKKKSDAIIRLDANGAFQPKEALKKIEMLAPYGIHSLEQPIAIHCHHEMQNLIKQSPIPIALDEELIGQWGRDKKAFLKKLAPHFIVIKPSLLGGFTESNDWIYAAHQLNIGWWITSYLESNIGLNAIAQFTANFSTPIHQGLGTGLLYQNNIKSPLEISDGFLFYNRSKHWGRLGFS